MEKDASVHYVHTVSYCHPETSAILVEDLGNVLKCNCHSKVTNYFAGVSGKLLENNIEYFLNLHLGISYKPSVEAGTSPFSHTLHTSFPSSMHTNTVTQSLCQSIC